MSDLMCSHVFISLFILIRYFHNSHSANWTPGSLFLTETELLLCSFVENTFYMLL